MARRPARPAAPLALALLLAPVVSAQQDKEFFVERQVRMSALGQHWARRVALVDMDADGRLDVVTVAEAQDEVSIARQDADGTFALPLVYDVGSNPIGFAIGDVNLDGHLDVVTANWLSGGLSVLLGDGDGAIAKTFTLATALGPERVAIADLDGNGWPDLLAVRAGKLAVLRSFGGTFAPPVHYDAPADPVEVHVDDIDGDGLLDALVTWGDGVSLLPGDGLGGFGPPVSVASLSYTWGMGAGDMDDDGHLDLVLARATPAWQVDVLLGDGAGAFTPAGSAPISSLGRAVGLADLDHDGDLDVAVAETHRLTTLLGDGAGGLVVAGSHDIGDPAVYERLALADVDGDGRVDAALPGYTASNVALLRGDGLGGFHTIPPPALALVQDPISPVLGDLDGDGHLDAVVAHLTEDRLRVALGDGAGGFRLAGDLMLGTFEIAHEVILAELTGDGALDIVSANKDGSLEGLHLWEGDGAGGFLPAVVVPGANAADSVAAVDLDGDGDRDLVMGGSAIALSVITLFGNDGAGAFTQLATVATGAHPDSIVVEDLDGDGALDIAWSNGAVTSSIVPKIVYGDGLGGWDPPVATPLEGWVDDLAVVDANEDGLPDLAAVRGYDISLALALAPRVYAAPVIVTGAGRELIDLRVVDVDVDGHDDFIAIHEDAGVTVVRGDGTGAFGPPQLYGTWDRVTGMAVGDVDEDGKPDLVTTSDGGPGTTWSDSRLAVHDNRALGVGPWQDAGSPLAGSIGLPVLAGDGTLEPSSPVSLAISGALPGGIATLAIGPVAIGLPFKGGTFVPLPAVLVFGLPLDASGGFQASGTWYAGLPAGTDTWFQAWLADPAGPAGFAATNALRGTTP